MALDVRTSKVGFLSHDGTSTIRGVVWEPARRAHADGASLCPRGVVQIVHGMAEHVERYDAFARYLVERGFIVCGEDHIGHGHSVADESRLGCLPPDGKEIMIEDVHELRTIVMARYAKTTPYFIFGHSMGSFITRAYLARHGQGVTGAVICGTGQQPLLVSRAGNWLARFLCRRKGPDYRSAFLDNLGVGAYAKQIKDARTSVDWICTDPVVVDAYIADPLCGAMFSVGGYATLTDLTGEVATRECAERVPKDLPVLLVAGEEDPVGSCGTGVRKVFDQFKAAGIADVQLKLYPGMRHEILNESGHAEVFEDVETWMEKALP